jgi:Ca2+-binding RTX toxin-like protein
MTTYSYLSDVNVTGASVHAITIVDFDMVYVAQGTSISASGSGSAALKGTHDDRVSAHGDMFGDYAATWLDSDQDNSSIFVSGTGSLAGNVNGIIAFGSNNKVTNAGTVTGYYGVVLAGGNQTVHNTGLIQAESYAINLAGIATETNRILNSGEILSPSIAILTDAADDTVLNKGLIAGVVFLGAGNDVFDTRGGLVDGKVLLQLGNDIAIGGNGTEWLEGGDGNDWLRGRFDDDTLNGGNGKDKLNGGADRDEFRFTTPLSAGNVDTLVDFSATEDTIVLAASIFTALGPSVGKAEFAAKASGHAATNATQKLIYDKSNGTLWFDADGNGAGVAVKLAQLGTAASHPMSLTHNTFSIDAIV